MWCETINKKNILLLIYLLNDQEHENAVFI